MLDDLAQLNEGATGPRRKQLERKLGAHLEMLQADMRGEEANDKDLLLSRVLIIQLLLPPSIASPALAAVA